MPFLASFCCYDAVPDFLHANAHLAECGQPAATLTLAIRRMSSMVSYSYRNIQMYVSREVMFNPLDNVGASVHKGLIGLGFPNSWVR